MTGQRCTHIRADGSRCKTRSNLGADGLCVWHSPSRTLEARAIRREGGRATARRRRRGGVVGADEVPPAPETLEDVARWASWTAVACATGELGAGPAREVVAALRTLLAALQARGSEDEEVEQARELLAALAGKSP